MIRSVAGEAARLRPALVVMVSGALALLVPSLSVSTIDASSAVMLTAVAALVAAVGIGRRLTTVVNTPLAGPVHGAAETPAFLALRVTDNLHHPARPRAPGVV